MNLDGLSLFHLMGQKLGWLGSRQTVLSQNVANADTPGYKPKDLKAFSLDEPMVKPANLLLTNPMHMQGTRAPILANMTQGEIIEQQPDGNAVSLEDQLVKATGNATDYEMVINLYRKQVGLMKTAIGRTGS